MTESRARKIVLDCEHILWMKPPLPNAGEQLYCRPCGTYKPVGPVATNGRIYEDEWSWERAGRIFRGRCETCREERTNPNWYRLRDSMDSHYFRAHSGSSLIFDTPRPIPAPKGRRSDAPPF